MLKCVLIAAVVLVLLVVATLAALPWFLNTPAFHAYVSQSAAHALGRPVKFASLSISPFPLPTVRLRGLQVGEDPAFGPDPFVTVGEGTVGIRLKPLFSGRVELADVTLEEPRVELVEDNRGRWNWASLGVPAASPGGAPRSGGRTGSPATGAVLLSRVSIVNGTMRYRKLGTKGSDLQLEKVNLAVSQTAPGGALRLSGDVVVQPGSVGLKISEASLSPAGARSLAEMALKATVDVEARDVSQLARGVVSSTAVAGAMNGRLLITGTPARIVVAGAMGLERLAFSEDRPQCQPRRRQLVLGDLRIPVTYAGLALDSGPIEAKVARGTVSLRLAVGLGPAPTVAFKDVKVKDVELGTILIDFLCQPYAVTGPVDLTGQARLGLADPWRTASGSGRLRIGPGKVLGKEVVTLLNDVVGLTGVVSSVLSPERRFRPGSPLDFDSITASYRINSGVVKTEDLLYEATGVKVAASGTVALYDGRVNMDVTLTQGPNQVKGVVSGTTGALKVIPTGVQVGDTRGIRKFLDKLFR